MIVDLFSGPGGWIEALRLHDRHDDAVGIELDRYAVETSRAAGHRCEQGDVETYLGQLHGRDVEGLVGGPPCPTFSVSGRGAGRAKLPEIVAAIADGPALTVAARVAHLDERTRLVVQPLRYAAALRPQWIALEQVPTVLPIWQAIGRVLEDELGYGTWTGRVEAETFGVPQTRKRTILLAVLGAEVGAPVVTHRKYRKGVAQDEGDPALLPWVSMAQGIGRGMTARPSMTVTGGGTSTGGAEPFGNAARKGMLREIEAGRWTEPLPYERPATTIVGSFRPDVVAGPGWCKAGDGPRQNAPGSVRVTVEEAAVLQSFRRDYPWQGSKGKQHQQIGNAVPPLMGAHVLDAVLDAVEGHVAAGFQTRIA